MLPLGLVLLLATSALAAPSVIGVGVPANQYPIQRDNGALINKNVIQRVASLVDGGETNLYSKLLLDSATDLADQRDATSQALAAGQIIALIGELAVGNPGDACEAAALANAAASGNPALVRAALPGFVSRLQYNIDVITQLNAGNNNVRYMTAPRSNCQGGGKVYNLEGLWAAVQNNVGSNYLLDQIVCASRFLNNTLQTRNTNAGVSVAAASSPAVVSVLKQSLPQLGQFLRVVANGGNAAGVANALKAAISNNARNY